MNYRMTTFIIGKMLGVEGALLLLPAAVAFLYGEKSGLSFLMVSAVLLIIFLIFGREKTGQQADLRQRRTCYRGFRLDIMVIIRRVAVFHIRVHTELSGRIF